MAQDNGGLDASYTSQAAQWGDWYTSDSSTTYASIPNAGTDTVTGADATTPPGASPAAGAPTLQPLTKGGKGDKKGGSGSGNSGSSGSGGQTAQLDEAYLTNVFAAANSYSPPLTPDQKSAALLLIRDPTATVPDQSFIAGVVTSITAEAAQVVQAAPGTPASWTPPVGDPATFNTQYSAAVTAAVQAATSNPQLQAQLIFAYYHPELSSSALVQQVQSLGIQQTVNTTLAAAGITLPAGWTNVGGFDLQVTQDADAQFQTNLANYSTANNLTQEQTQMIMTIHYHPELLQDPAFATANAALIPIATSLFQQAVTQISAQDGLPATLPATYPPPDTDQYDTSIRSDYQFTNSYNLQQYIDNSNPPMSAADQALLTQAMEDPNAVVPDNIRATATTLLQQTITTIDAKYGVPQSTWLPPGAAVSQATLWSGPQAQFNALSSANQLVSSAQAMVNALPSGPLKGTMFNYLQAISAALSALSTQIYNSQSQNAMNGQKESDAQADASQMQIANRMEQIQKQITQLAQIAKDEAKASKFSGIMSIIGPIVIAVSVVMLIGSLGSMGPIAGTVIVATMTMMIIQQAGGPNGMASILNGVAKVLQAMDPQMSDQTAQTIASVIVVLIVIALTRNLDTSADGDFMTLSTVAMSDNMFGNIAVSCGANAQQAMIVGAVFAAAMMLGCMGTGGGTGDIEAAVQKAITNIEAKIDQLTEEIAQDASTIAEYAARALAVITRAILRVATMLLKFAAKVLKSGTYAMDVVSGIGATLNLGNAGVGVATAWYQSDILHKQGDMEVMNAQADAEDTLTQDVLDEIKVLIKQLQTMMQGLSDWNQSISQLQSQKWKDASDIMSNLSQPT